MLFVISVCAVATPEVFENMQTGSNLINGSVYIYQLRRTNKYGEPRIWIWAQIQGPYIGLGEIDGFIDPATFVDHRFIDRASDWDTYEVVELMDAWAAANPDKMVP